MHQSCHSLPKVLDHGFRQDTQKASSQIGGLHSGYFGETRCHQAREVLRYRARNLRCIELRGFVAVMSLELLKHVCEG